MVRESTNLGVVEYMSIENLKFGDFQLKEDTLSLYKAVKKWVY